MHHAPILLDALQLADDLSENGQDRTRLRHPLPLHVACRVDLLVLSLQILLPESWSSIMCRYVVIQTHHPQDQRIQFEVAET